MTLTIREAAIADAALITALTRSCWAGSVAPSSAAHREIPVIVAQDLSGGGAFLLFAGQEPVGSVRWAAPDTNPHLWEVRRMGILPAYRQQALSRLLLEAVITAAGIRSIAELRLAVRHDQPHFLQLYAGYGFELAPGLAYAHANPEEPAPYVMRRFLKS
ncbi:GNAT family N-acetyltransferase [Undibacterium oligocarboniphilum]|uniref:GNAT family N-acetyltransferase n=1 Tax=Undibacterium oligocarboniphilum TaxID=666702 RepID=A0A850QEG5_9BURK|nr:GNAT family N-acetyltransferase [Undibacterium oligocarboniphilum]MBC3871355.1 GNAT family N-acetyltransferase [Undibacterium oligocarboniphilum]NVO78852.1 GNAT family N-acetyltransferase [Undibacterium oligocarboniphilum]